MGMEFRPYYFSKEWTKLGHNVRIVTANYSHLRKNNPSITKDFEIKGIDEINYQIIKTIVYNGNGIKRAISMFQFCFKLWFNAKSIAKDFKPDVVIASSTYPLDTYPAKHIASLAKCKYIHETHDLWPLTLIEIGGMSKYNPFVLLMSIAEKHAYSKADRVIGVAPNEVEYMLQHGLQNKEKFTCIQNGVVLEDWRNPQKLNEEYEKFFNKLHKDKKFIVCYVGGHAISNALDTLIEAARLNKEDNQIVYVLVGKGTEKERLINNSKDLNNVYFLNAIDKKEIPSLLDKADALYIGAKENLIYKYGVSMNKVYDYMMSGKPIIYGVKAFNNDVEKADAGITVRPNNPNDINMAINKIVNMSEIELKRLKKRSKEFVINNYDYERLSKDFLSLIK